MVGASGIFDTEYTQTQVDYSKFGNFVQAGKLPNVVAGITEIETEETVKNTGVSDLLSMGGTVVDQVSSIAKSADAAKKASGSFENSGIIDVGSGVISGSSKNKNVNTKDNYSIGSILESVGSHTGYYK